MPISSLCDDGQPGKLAKEASRRAIDKRDEKKEKDGAIKTHHKIQPNAATGRETPLQQLREDEEHVKDDSLHGIEADEPAEAPRIPDDGEVKSEENEDPVKGKSLEEADSGNKRLKQNLKSRELGDHEFSVMDPVHEWIKIACGGDEAVRRLDLISSPLLG